MENRRRARIGRMRANSTSAVPSSPPSLGRRRGSLIPTSLTQHPGHRLPAADQSAFATLVSGPLRFTPIVVRTGTATRATSSRTSEYPSSLRIEAIHARIQIHLLPPTIERPLLRGTRGRLACVSHENHDSSDDRTRLEPDNPP